MKKANIYHSFITGSRYVGTYNSAIHCMEGFGRYIYPDGTEYNGYFKRGKFHGFGRLTLSEPYHFSFVGEYEDGKLINVHDMVYGDGVRLQATLEKNKLNLDSWLYCTPKDRRFASEIFMGLQPVEHEKSVTEDLPPRDLPRKGYDCGEGIFKPTSGCIVSIPPPFFRIRFVGCNKELSWIVNNCRKGPFVKGIRPLDEKPREPPFKVGRRIIDMNTEAMNEINTCTCNSLGERKAYLAKMCKTELLKMGGEEPSGNDSVSELAATQFSESTSSFTEQIQIIDNIQEKCELEVHLLKPIDVDTDTDIDDQCLIDRKSRNISVTDIY